MTATKNVLRAGRCQRLSGGNAPLLQLPCPSVLPAGLEGGEGTRCSGLQRVEVGGLGEDLSFPVC